MTWLLTFALLAALGGLGQAKLTRGSIPADHDFLVKQRDIIRLFMKVHEHNHFVDQVDLVKDYDPSVDGKFKDIIPVKTLVKHFNAGTMLHRGAIFSLFNEEHREEMILLFESLFFAQDYETFFKTAVWARDRINEGQFVYALSVAVLHRDDCKGIVLPPAYEIYPHMFVNSEVINAAYKAKMTQTPAIVHMNFTGTVLNPEQRVAYLGEDVGLNSHHAHWHMDFPFWWKASEYGVEKARHLAPPMSDTELHSLDIRRFPAATERALPSASLGTVQEMLALLRLFDEADARRPVTGDKSVTSRPSVTGDLAQRSSASSGSQLVDEGAGVGHQDTPQWFDRLRRRDAGTVDAALPPTSESTTPAVAAIRWITAYRRVVPESLLREESPIRMTSARTSPAVSGLVHGARVTLLIDTGSEVSCMSEELWNTLTTTTRAVFPTLPADGVSIVGVLGKSQKITRRTTLPVVFGDFSSEVVFLVVEGLNAPCILGMDWLTSVHATMDFEKRQVSVFVEPEGRVFDVPFVGATAVADAESALVRVAATAASATAASATTQLPGPYVSGAEGFGGSSHTVHARVALLTLCVYMTVNWFACALIR